MLAVILSFGKIQGTNSFFMDTANVGGNEIGAGYWIPTLSMSVSPLSPDGDDGWYVTSPCITLTVSGLTVGSATIYYEFSNDGDPIAGGTAYPGSCVPVPDGNPTHFQAQAVNDLNPDWKSNIESGQFKVDTQDPVVDITLPANGATVSGSVSIKGTVTDDNPKYYSLKIKDPLNNTIYDSGNVLQPSSFTNQLIHTWDTSALADGDYTIELKGRDQAGNEADDSIAVSVSNGPAPGDVVINEVMWSGSTNSNADEWIELRNMTDNSIDIGQWRIKNARHSGGTDEIMIPASNSIPAHGYFLIANYPKTSANTELDVDVDEVNNNLSLYDVGNGHLKLKTPDGVVIDEVKGDHWPAGWHGIAFHMSMERNGTPGDGLNSGSWHTCIDVHCNDTTYWKHEGFNFGTPGHANLSDNDPTDADFNGTTLPSDVTGDDVAVQEDDAVSADDQTAATDVTETPPADEGASTTNDTDNNSDNTEVADTTTDTTTGTDASSETGATQDEPVLVKKEFDINLKGKLDVPEGLEAEVNQKIKKVEVRGEEKVLADLGEVEVDLAKIEIKKEGKIEITVGDLDLPKGVKVVSHESDDVVLEITVSKKKEDSQDSGKDDGKKDEVKPASDDAALKPDSSSIEADQKDEKDDKKDGSGDGSGDKNSNDSKPGDNDADNNTDPVK